MYRNIVRWWLTGILLLLPFQEKIVESIVLWNNELSTFVSYLDEITIIIFLLLAIREHYKGGEIFDRLYIILLLPILLLSISGFISGMINGNSLFITSLGVFDYIKNFLVIFIYAAFFREVAEFKKVFSLLLLMAVFFGIVAFIQEFWAMVSRYILEKDINDITYLLTENRMPELSWRFGIYRAPSVINNSNILGLYSLLILVMYVNIAKKVNFVLFSSLLAGVYLSVSRIAYAGFVFVSAIQIFRCRRWLLGLVTVPIVALLFYMSSFPDFNINLSGLIKKKNMITYNMETYRAYARDKAMEIWKDHPFWGVGPGMFGGVVSVKYRSHIYEEYNFARKYFLERMKSIDQFWPQILAEVGIVGIVTFAGFFILLIIIFFILRFYVTGEMQGLFTGLAVFTMVIPIYTFSNGLNITPVLFSYSAMAGMGLGCGRFSYKHLNLCNR